MMTLTFSTSHAILLFIKLVGVQGFEPYTLNWSRWQDSNLRHPAPKAGGMNQTILHRVYTSLCMAKLHLRIYYEHTHDALGIVE